MIAPHDEMQVCPRCRTVYASRDLRECFRDGAELVPFEPERSVTELAPGSVVGARYRIVGTLGRGGMGVVYEGVQLSLERSVAVKVLHPKIGHDAEMVQRFRREARILSMLRHPNTVRIYDFGETDQGHPYVVMEKLGGHSLAERLRTGPLRPRQAVHVAQQILASLVEAHGMGLVHRDLKPENVMLTHGMEDGLAVAKVLDFGIAKSVADRSVNQFETQGYVILGTPRYMSPEQAQGDDVDARSDLYSVGTMLFEMLAGRPPVFGWETVPAKVDPRRGRPPAPQLDQGLEQVPAELRRVVTQAMARTPEERFPNAGAFYHALNAALRAEQASHRPSRPAWAWTRRA